MRGGFLFDDYGTLAALSDYGPLATATDFERFVFTGTTGPGGRPIALSTFLVDMDAWPGDASAFKRTNLLLHLLAGVLVAWLGLAIGKATAASPSRSAFAAVIGAALWLLHPLLLSTTLYVVQRMTILAAIFVLGGLVAHVHLRLALARAQSATRVAALLGAMSASLAVFTLLALLSKENGALLPTLALVLELTVLRSVSVGVRPSWTRGALVLLLIVPTLVIAGYLVLVAYRVGLGVIPSRGFTDWQRLLSEGRVLIDYLGSIVVPRIDTGGVYHDDFVVSTGLSSPPTTLLAWLAVFILIALAWRLRARSAIASCAVLFFFAGHALESTTIPLELYFEHRNYLPAVLLAIAGGAGIARIGASRGWLQSAAVAVVAIGILAWLTSQRALLWSDPDALRIYWAEKSPRSERAQLEAAQTYLRRHELAPAMRHLDAGLAANPDSIALLTVRFSLACSARQDPRATFDALRTALQRVAYRPDVRRAIEKLFASPTIDHCMDDATDVRSALADALMSNPSAIASPLAHQQVLFFKGLADLHAGRVEAAQQAFAGALDTAYEYEAGMRMVAELADAGAFACSLVLLRQVEREDARQSERAFNAGSAVQRQQEFARLRAEILKDRPRADQAGTMCSREQE